MQSEWRVLIFWGSSDNVPISKLGDLNNSGVGAKIPIKPHRLMICDHHHYG